MADSRTGAGNKMSLEHLLVSENKEVHKNSNKNPIWQRYVKGTQ